jgi:hypothetical protein
MDNGQWAGQREREGGLLAARTVICCSPGCNLRSRFRGLTNCTVCILNLPSAASALEKYAGYAGLPRSWVARRGRGGGPAAAGAGKSQMEAIHFSTLSRTMQYLPARITASTTINLPTTAEIEY